MLQNEQHPTAVHRILCLHQNFPRKEIILIDSVVERDLTQAASTNYFPSVTQGQTETDLQTKADYRQ